jgi:prevent-host-death family protein
MWLHNWFIEEPMMNDTIVGVRELKARLSEYLREVKSGKVVTITEHGKPIGRIIPEGQSIDKKLQRLIETGLILWSGEKVAPHTPTVVNLSEKQVSDILVEMRE